MQQSNPYKDGIQLCFQYGFSTHIHIKTKKEDAIGTFNFNKSEGAIDCQKEKVGEGKRLLFIVVMKNEERQKEEQIKSVTYLVKTCAREKSIREHQ